MRCTGAASTFSVNGQFGLQDDMVLQGCLELAETYLQFGVCRGLAPHAFPHVADSAGMSELRLTMSSQTELAAACASSTVSAGLRFSPFRRLGLAHDGAHCTLPARGPSEVGIMVEAGQSTLLKIADVPWTEAVKPQSPAGPA